MKPNAAELWTGRVLLVTVMALTIIPFITLFITALHPSGSYPSGLELPEEYHWGNFVTAFQSAQMGKMLWSSIIIELGVVPIALLIATLAGFALGHLKVPFARTLFVVFILGLTLPFEGIIVPLYYQIREYGLLNTHWAIILPLIGLFMPFAVLWMRAHFISMPHDLTEAARMDGATTWQLFWRVHVPLSRPAIASLAILLFLWTWNQFLLAIVLVDDPTKRTMAGALGAFQGQWGTNIPLLCAGSLLILTPVLIVFIIFQRQFVAALLQGAVKG